MYPSRIVLAIYLRMVGNKLPTIPVYGFGFFFPCAPPSSAGWSGGFGEDCLSTQCEFRSRLTCRATQGTAKRR